MQAAENNNVPGFPKFLIESDPLDSMVVSHRSGSILYMVLRGEFDLDTTISLRDAVYQGLEEVKCIDLVADISRVTYMDSSAMGIFVNAMQILRRRLGSVYLIGAQPNIQRLLAVTRLNRIFSLYPTWEDAEPQLLRSNLKITEPPA